MKTLVPIIFFCILLHAPLKAEADPGEYDRAISVAVDNMVRHEKRYLSTGDVFNIGIYPNANALVISAQVNDEYNNRFVAIVTPKDTTLKPERFADQDRIIWVSPASKDTVIAVKGLGPEEYSISYSPDAVQIDYSDLPNKILASKGKLFVWRDEACADSKEVIDRLTDLNRVDFLIPEAETWWSYIDDGVEVVCYDLDALREGKIKKHHNYGLWGDGFRARLRRGWFQLWH